MSCEKLQTFTTFNLNLTRTVSETWHTAGPLQSGHDTVQTFNICHILRHTHLWCMKRKTFQKQWNRNETSGCIMSSFSEFCDKTTRSKKQEETHHRRLFCDILLYQLRVPAQRLWAHKWEESCVQSSSLQSKWNSESETDGVPDPCFILSLSRFSVCIQVQHLLYC